MATALLSSAIPEIRPYAQEADRPQHAPDTLLVAGVRDVNSLGWFTARNWLEEVPNSRIIATYRSKSARDFLANQSSLYSDRVTGIEVDWLGENPSEKLAEELDETQNFWLTQYGHRLNIAGVAHCIARADITNFTMKATELEEKVFIDAFKVGALSLVGLVRASRTFMAPGTGIVTFGYGNPERTEPGYGPAMQIAKASLTKAVMILAEELGKSGEDKFGKVPQARVAEIVTGYIPTRSGKGVAVLQKKKPKDMEKKSIENALLDGTSGALQAESAGRLAVLFMRDPAFTQTTGQRFFVDGGINARSPLSFS